MKRSPQYKREMAKAVEALESAREIGLASHVNPDGDSLGSLLAMCMTLVNKGKIVHATFPDPSSYPPQYLFLPGKELLSEPKDMPAGLEAFVTLDCSNRERLESMQAAAEGTALLINIDHHEDNRLYGDFNLVDKGASSTSELVFELMESAAWEIEPEVATCLYTGLVTDTGRFQHQNTSPDTFMVASRMAEAGADIFTVIKEVYENQSASYLRLLGIALQRIKVLEEHGLVYSYITRGDLDRTGAVLPETEDLIDHLRVVRGTRLAALFKEMEGGKVRVSLRSRDGCEVGPVARRLGGGGHAMAAGYTSDLDIPGSIDKLLEVLRDAG